jgi:hypothetical protein
MEPNKQEFKIPAWAFPLLSWIVAAYFLIAFLKKSAFPPDLTTGTTALGVPALVFLFFPFFTKIKIGKVLELEREVQKAKKDLSDFKTEVRSTLSVLSTNVNTIGGMSNQITVNIPALAELQRARQDVASAIPVKAKEEAEKVENRIIRQSEDDKTMALARTRIDIERTLREVLGKQTYLPPEKLESVKFASITKLFAMAAEIYPTLPSLQTAFKYVNQVCNAAIHGQRVSDQQADEAIALGAEVLAALQAFDRGDMLP